MVLAGRRLFFSATTEETGYEPYLLEVGAILDFHAWTEAAGLGGMSAAPSASPHGDGIDNLPKYAFGIDGTSFHHGSAAGQPGQPGQPGQLPLFTIKVVGDQKLLTVKYTRRVGSLLVYLAQRSNNLEEGSFVPMEGEEVVGLNVGGWEQVTRSELVSGEKWFGRVEVKLP
jgi:hypothetical protein